MPIVWTSITHAIILKHIDLQFLFIANIKELYYAEPLQNYDIPIRSL